MSAQVARVLTVAAIVLVTLATGTLGAAAAEFDAVLDGLRADGFYLEPGGENLDPAELDRIASQADFLFYPVVLAETPEGGEDLFGEDLADQLGGTVLVLSPNAIGYGSDQEPGVVDDALDVAEEQADPLDTLAYLVAFREAYEEPTGGTSAGGGRGLLAVLAGVLAFFGLFGFIRRRSRRRAAEEQQQQALEEARQEVKSQLSAMAAGILELTDHVTAAGDQETEARFTDATTAYAAAQSALEQTTSLAALEQTSDSLDRARWRLESVRARLDGRPEPPEPQSDPACFFDPTHGAGTQEASVETVAGARAVRVCTMCAQKLEQGQAPEPRMITVSGRPMPAALAPRSYGGGGFGVLGDIAIILGGHRQPYGWGGYDPYRRGDGWGGVQPRRWSGGIFGGSGGWGGSWGSSGGSSSGGGSWGGGSWGGGRSSSGGGRSRSGGVSRSSGSRTRSGGGGGRSRSSGGRRR